MALLMRMTADENEFVDEHDTAGENGPADENDSADEHDTAEENGEGNSKNHNGPVDENESVEENASADENDTAKGNKAVVARTENGEANSKNNNEISALTDLNQWRMAKQSYHSGSVREEPSQAGGPRSNEQPEHPSKIACHGFHDA